MQIIDRDDRMQNENQLEKDLGERIAELMYKLDISCAKVEQCAFDSINTTDQVMMGMQVVMELMQEVISKQFELCSAMEISSLTLDEKEGESLVHLAGQQSQNLSKLEIELHKVIEAAVEANDAARCIESGVDEQSENIANLVQLNEEIMNNF